jgi:hypothetical protein
VLSVAGWLATDRLQAALRETFDAMNQDLQVQARAVAAAQPVIARTPTPPSPRPRPREVPLRAG